MSDNFYGELSVIGMRGCEELELNEALVKTYEAWCAENPVDHGVWGHWPRFYPEMPIDASAVKNAYLWAKR